jgi:glycosyltransferase involved in cell wall biosynthesis
MACGTPVIATRAASVPEVVGDAAYAVDPFDVGALAGAMTEILANDDLARDLRERGLARATLFSWDRTAREVRAHLHAPSAR